VSYAQKLGINVWKNGGKDGPCGWGLAVVVNKKTAVRFRY